MNEAWLAGRKGALKLDTSAPFTADKVARLLRFVHSGHVEIDAAAIFIVGWALRQSVPRGLVVVPRSLLRLIALALWFLDGGLASAVWPELIGVLTQVVFALYFSLLFFFAATLWRMARR